MLRLVKNELRQNTGWLVLLLGLLALLELLGLNIGRGAYDGLLFGLGMGNLMVVAFLSREMHYSGLLLQRILPLDAGKVIAAMYVTICILSVGFAASGYAVQWIVGLVNHASINHNQFDPGYPILHTLVVRVVGWWILLAILLPLAIRYGSVLRIVLAYVVIGGVHTIASVPLLKVSVWSAETLGPKGWILSVVLLFAVISGASLKVSARALRQMEF